MPNKKLTEYAGKLMKQGYSAEAVREAFLKKGYTNQQIDEVLINLGKSEEKKIKIIVKEWWGNRLVQGIVIGVLIIILMIVYFILTAPRPPELLFIDKSTNMPLTGKIYLDFRYVGDEYGDGFNAMPELFCESEHIVSIETSEAMFNWTSYPSDCEFNRLTLLIEYIGGKPFTAREDEGVIKLNFLYEDTGEPIKGNISINGEFIGEIDGFYLMFLEECKVVDNITLYYDNHYSDWFMNRELCEYDEINLKAGESGETIEENNLGDFS